jgi:hypothetical protein
MRSTLARNAPAALAAIVEGLKLSIWLRKCDRRIFFCGRPGLLTRSSTGQQSAGCFLRDCERVRISAGGAAHLGWGARLAGVVGTAGS